MIEKELALKMQKAQRRFLERIEADYDFKSISENSSKDEKEFAKLFKEALYLSFSRGYVDAVEDLTELKAVDLPEPNPEIDQSVH